MTSVLKVDTIQNSTGTDAISVDSNGDLTFSGSNTITPTDSGWHDVTFESGYGNYGGSFQNVRYRKIGNIVYVKGLMTPATLGTAFVLPEGYRPAEERELFDAINSNAQGRIDVYSNGNVNCNTMTDANSWVNIDLMFFVD